MLHGYLGKIKWGEGYSLPDGSDRAFPLAWSSVTHIIGSVSVQKVVARLDNGFYYVACVRNVMGEGDSTNI